MNYCDYVKRIGFRHLQPHQHYAENQLTRLKKLLGYLGNRNTSPTDLWITKLPEQEKQTKAVLRQLVDCPRMSSFAIAALVNAGVAQMQPGSAYVNVGVWHGFTFLAGLLNNPNQDCIGIDNFSQFAGVEDGSPETLFWERFKRYKSDRHTFYEMDYIDYFKQVHQQPIGFYFYDGRHHYEDQLEALKIAEPFFDDRCFILVDDTSAEFNQGAARNATYDFLKERGDRYQVVLDVTPVSFSHPTWWNGVILFQKVAR